MLIEQGIDAKMVTGFITNHPLTDDPGQWADMSSLHHTWVEAVGYVIDVTIDQWDKEVPRRRWPKILVVKRDSPLVACYHVYGELYAICSQKWEKPLPPEEVPQYQVYGPARLQPR